MSYVVALPQVMSAASTNVASIGSVVATAGEQVAGATTGLLAAAEDEVSAAIAAFFSAHGQGYQALSAQAAAFHEQFVGALAGASEAYAAAEAANAAPLAAFEQVARDVQQLPAAAATGFESLFSVRDSPILKLLASDLPPLSWVMGNSPPPLLNLLLGQTVSYSTHEGMNVVTITPARPTGENVVAIHGGAFIFPASFFHWINYSVTSYMTGATFQVPIYPLIQEGGTAATVVPKMASFISSQIALHGIEDVSVVGDSAGGNLALAAVQHMLSLGDPAPSSMVLISPWLDVSLGSQVGMWWGANLPITNPMVSPLFGSLTGLPSTFVYSGGLDPLVVSANALQRAAVSQGAPISFVLAQFQSHDWVILSPYGLLFWPQINQELGIVA